MSRSSVLGVNKIPVSWALCWPVTSLLVSPLYFSS